MFEKEQTIHYEKSLPEKRPPLWKRWTAVGALATLGTFGVQNYETIDAYYPFVGDSDLMPEVIGCPELPEDYQALPTEEYSFAIGDVQSAARSFNSAGVRPFETLNAIRTFFDYPQESFTSRHSGIEFTFYSDKPEAQWTIDPEAFDDLFHFALTSEHEYPLPQVNHIVGCLQERILEDQEFAGEEYAIYIPSDPRTCLGEGRFIDLEEQPDATCQQRGFAPPKIDVSIGPFELFEGRIIILTGGSNNETRYSSIQRIAAHEAIHAHTALPGEQRFQLEANEKWVQYQERQLQSYQAEEYALIPPFIDFHDGIKDSYLDDTADIKVASTNNTRTE